MQAKLAGLLARTAKVSHVVPARDPRLQDDFGLDSLSMIDLAVATEDAFGIRIPDDDH